MPIAIPARPPVQHQGVLSPLTAEFFRSYADTGTAANDQGILAFLSRPGVYAALKSDLNSQQFARVQAVYTALRQGRHLSTGPVAVPSTPSTIGPLVGSRSTDIATLF